MRASEIISDDLPIQIEIHMSGPSETHHVHLLNIIAKYGNKIIGHGRFAFDPKTKFGEFWAIGVEAYYRRRGVATKMYDYIQELGYVIKPSDTQSNDAKEFWKSRNK